MRILMANHALKEWGGTEQWTASMADALRRRGHDVDIFCIEMGPVAEQLGATQAIAPAYDAKLLNHQSCVRLLARVGGVTVQTCHGPSHTLEQPAPNCEAYVGVSQEVVAALKDRVLPATLITNGIDLQHFTPGPPLRETPRVLSLCKTLDGKAMVADVCRRQGWDFDYLHYQEKPADDIVPYLHWADVVVSYGRGVYEAMACGRRVMCFDARRRAGQPTPRGDGWVTPDTVSGLRRRNCSGRMYDQYWDVDELEARLFEYTPTPMWERQYAEQELNVDDKAQQYLNLIHYIQEAYHEQQQQPQHDRAATRA